MSRGQGLSGRGARARALGQRLQGWEAGPLGGGRAVAGRREGLASGQPPSGQQGTRVGTGQAGKAWGITESEVGRPHCVPASPRPHGLFSCS